MSRPNKYNICVGDTIHDFTCVGTSQNAYGKTVYIMRCNICGREKQIIAATFLGENPRGITHKSCGQFEKTTDKHFHDVWCNIRSRTTNPKSSHYSDYGGRGIKSDAFKNFIDFKDAMYSSYLNKKNQLNGENPSIERIDVNGDYTPENCTWISVHEQKGNQRKTVEFDVIFPDGHCEHHRNVCDFARKHNLDDSTIYDVMNGKTAHHRGFKFVRTNSTDK